MRAQLSMFQVQEHVIPSQYVREYPGGLKPGVSGDLKLFVKQYVPLDHLRGVPAQKRVTIIGTHGNGFPIEMYEPLWDDLLAGLRSKGCDIAGVWVASCVHQGQSGVLNEAIIGDDTSWFDHSRDLLHMINHFRDEMTRPIIGIGHSMGCAQLVQLSIMHPRLLNSLVLMEPVIQDGAPAGPNAALMATMRPDLWQNRTEAEAPLRRSKLFASWDPRVFEKFLTFSLRETPSALYPNESTAPGSITLTTTKHQEAWSYVRANFEPRGNAKLDRLLEPDLDSEKQGAFVSFRPECTMTLKNLPHLRPSVFWLFGQRSSINTSALNQQKLDLTGAGVGGSGGAATGRVRHVVIDKASHFLPCEKTSEVAQQVAVYLADTALPLCESDDQVYREFGGKKSTAGMTRVSNAWKTMVRRPANEMRPFSSAKM